MPPAAKTLFENLLAVLLHGVRMRSVQIRLRRSLRGFWIPKNVWTGNFIVCFDLLANGRISAFTVGPCPLGCSENGILFKVLIRNWYKLYQRVKFALRASCSERGEARRQ